MIGKAFLSTNYDEVEESKEMGVAIEHEMITKLTGFKLDDVKIFHKDQDGNIKIYFGYEDQTWAFEFDQKIWDALIEHFTE